MKNEKVKFLLCGLFFIALAAITFRCAWGSDMVFSASDLNIGRLAFIKNYLPEFLTGFFTDKPILGNASFSYRVFNIVLAVMPLIFFANVFYGLVLVFGSVSLVWFLRIWKRGWVASIFGALVAFWFNSILLAAGGHAYKMEVLAFSVLSLCWIEKAIRSVSIRQSTGFSLLAGISIGIMVLEQQDVALLAGLFVGSYAVFRLVQVHGRVVQRWLAVLLPIAVVALLLSGSTVLRSYERNIAGAASVQEDGDTKWNYITQWSMVPSEWPELVALGWSGWSSGNPKGPYWGKLGQSAEWESTKQGFRNFKLTSNYFGIIPFLLGGFGLAMALRGRKSEEGAQVLFWSVAGMLGLWLAFGKYSILYKLFYQLPMVGNIRAPIKLLDNFQICLGIVAAYGLDHLLAEGKGNKSSKVLWIAGSVLGGLMLLAGLRLIAFPAEQAAEFTQMGFGNFADAMVRNMSNAWFHSALFAFVAAGLAFMVWKGVKQAKWVAVVFVAALAVDSLLMTSHYFKADNVAALKNGNVVINYLKEHQGNERTVFADPGGIYNQWLASDGPYHGLNVFNIWQMPRMPVEYREYLGTVGRNQVRLWELSAIKYIATPASILQQFSQNPQLAELFQPVLNYQIPTAQGMRPDVLLEFKNTVPRFALFHNWNSLPLDEHCQMLVSSAHNPQTTLLLSADSGLPPQSGKGKFQRVEEEVTKKAATVNVTTDTRAILRFSQRKQSGWQVFLDGDRAELLEIDYLCMGVEVPRGKHVIEFRCISGMHRAMFSLGVLVLSSIAAVLLVRLGGAKVQ